MFFNMKQFKTDTDFTNRILHLEAKVAFHSESKFYLNLNKLRLYQK